MYVRGTEALRARPRVLAGGHNSHAGSPWVTAGASRQHTMVIDIYARWQGQTEEEIEAQQTGFSAYHGHVGYLREAYHGTPYATTYLLAEAFDHPEGAQIPSAVLKTRLPLTLKLVTERERLLYGETDRSEAQRVIASFIDFVQLCERKEHETGKPVTIIASY